MLKDLLKIWDLVPQTRLNTVAKKRARILLLSILAYTGMMLMIPRISDCLVKEKRMPDTFPDWEFTGHFKFRPQDFMRVLRALGLTYPDGCPIFLRIGDNAQCQSVVRSDWAFAVLVKRLATGGRYRDLQAVLGGSKTVLCNTFLYMLTFLYRKYKIRLGDFKFFRKHIPDFVKLFNNLCQKYHGIDCPYDNVIGLIDAHFVPTNRPGGDGCKYPNMYDTDVFNGKSKLHGLKYQGVTTPIGICILHGPFGGPESDAKMMKNTCIENDLATLTHECRQLDPNCDPLCVYGDSAYPETDYVVKAKAWALSNMIQRALNNIMKPVRVLVENNFAVIGQVAGINRIKLSLGSTPLGMVFPVSTLLTNIYSFLYGNTISATIPDAMQVLSQISLEDYLTV